MIFIVGLALIVVGIIMFFVFLVHAQQPKLEARVDEIVIQRVIHKGKPAGPPHRHAHISYVHEGIMQNKLILLKVKAKAGDTVRITCDPAKPDIVRIYAPRQELTAIAVLISVGLVSIAFCVFVMDYFNLWDK